MKQMLQERHFIESEAAAVLKQRRERLHESLMLQGRVYEALEVARMEMKFGISTPEQLSIFDGYLQILNKGNLQEDKSLTKLNFDPQIFPRP